MRFVTVLASKHFTSDYSAKIRLNVSIIIVHRSGSFLITLIILVALLRGLSISLFNIFALYRPFILLVGTS